MDKVRRIVHPKLKPFHFHIKTYYKSDANYVTDYPSHGSFVPDTHQNLENTAEGLLTAILLIPR